MVTGSGVMTDPTSAVGGLPSPVPRTVMSRSVTIPTSRSPVDDEERPDPVAAHQSRRPPRACSREGRSPARLLRHSLTSMSVHPVRTVRPVCRWPGS